MTNHRLKHKFIAFAFFSLAPFSYLDVLSAAHCVHGVDRRHIKIYIGGHNITSDYVDTRRVARIFEHEYFDSVSFDFDIAILELSKPIEFGPKIQPACLPQTQFQDYSGKTALIAGWGRLGSVAFRFFKWLKKKDENKLVATIKYKSNFNLKFVPQKKKIQIFV